jgi:uncharacterized protein (DUF1499 family)
MRPTRRRFLTRTFLFSLLGVGLWAVLAWPHINDVETGKTPDYPDLRPGNFAASPERIFTASKRALERLPQWQVVGSGHGPGGWSIQAIHLTPVVSLKEDVTIKITREDDRTIVRVRSKSRSLAWDFGQGARNIRQYLRALDQELFF